MMEEKGSRECSRITRMCVPMLRLIAASGLWDVELVVEEGMRVDKDNVGRSH